MSTQRFCIALLAALLTSSLLGSAAMAQHAGGHDLVVHEWGTFTSVAGDDGFQLEWRPLSGPSDLPGFVYDINSPDVLSGLRSEDAIRGKGEISGTVRMETPVIYFYTDKEMDVSVRVGFTGGHITEWYPRARGISNFRGVDWGRFRLMPGAEVELPTEDAPSHYYPARNVDAVPLKVCSDHGDEYEKFLFYRGVGSYALPLTARLDGKTIRLQERDKRPLGSFVVFERDGDDIRWQLHSASTAAASVPRPTRAASLPELYRTLEGVLVDQGLFRKEALAMIDTWRDHWFEDGLRVLYILPRELTDRILPLQIEPSPKALVRVIVGRVELITPELDAYILGEMKRAYHEPEGPRARRIQALVNAHGRFLPAVARRHVASFPDDPDKARLFELLRTTAPQPHP